MRHLVTIIALLIVSLTSFAESHGGVRNANAEFTAAAQFALNEGGDLYRVLSVTKLLGNACHKGSVFKIKWSSADSSGVERPDGSEAIVLVESDASEIEIKTKVTPLDSTECPSDK